MPSYQHPPGYAAHAVTFSPFDPDLVATCASEHFGIAGRGRVAILRLLDTALVQLCAFETKDCPFDVAWSEADPTLLLVAGGDGSVQLWSVGPGGPGLLRTVRAAMAEMASVRWNLVAKDSFLTGGLERRCCVWDPHRDAPLQDVHGAHPRGVRGAVVPRPRHGLRLRGG